MARTSVDNTVARIRRQLASGYRYESNLLNGSIDDVATTISFSAELTPNVRVGSLVCIDYEVMRVVTASSANRQATVIRGYYDSDSVAHTSGAEIQISPRFTPLDIVDAMQDEIASYGPQMYRVDTVELTTNDYDDIAALPVAWNDMYGLIEVRRKFVDTEITAWPRCNIRLQRNSATLLGGAPIIRFTDPMWAGTVQVRAARPFVLTSFTATTDLISDVKLPSSMLDVVSMGTKLRLLVDNENGRGARTAQDEPRRAEETPSGSMVQPFQFNNALYRNRRQEEINKLAALYPMQAV
jgi:hypothetical protein